MIDQTLFDQNVVKQINNYDILWNNWIELKSVLHHKVNVYKYLNCDDVYYLSKCELVKTKQKYLNIAIRTYLSLYNLKIMSNNFVCLLKMVYLMVLVYMNHYNLKQLEQFL